MIKSGGGKLVFQYPPGKSWQYLFYGSFLTAAGLVVMALGLGMVIVTASIWPGSGYGYYRGSVEMAMLGLAVMAGGGALMYAAWACFKQFRILLFRRIILDDGGISIVDKGRLTEQHPWDSLEDVTDTELFARVNFVGEGTLELSRDLAGFDQLIKVLRLMYPFTEEMGGKVFTRRVYPQVAGLQEFKEFLG